MESTNLWVNLYNSFARGLLCITSVMVKIHTRHNAKYLKQMDNLSPFLLLFCSYLTKLRFLHILLYNKFKQYLKILYYTPDTSVCEAVNLWRVNLIPSIWCYRTPGQAIFVHFCPLFLVYCLLSNIYNSIVQWTFTHLKTFRYLEGKIQMCL